MWGKRLREEEAALRATRAEELYAAYRTTLMDFERYCRESMELLEEDPVAAHEEALRRLRMVLYRMEATGPAANLLGDVQDLVSRGSYSRERLRRGGLL